MSTSKIIVPPDFTDPANNALRQAASLAKSTSSSLTLVHISDDDHPNEGENRARELCESMRNEFRVEIDYILEPGDLFEDIGRLAQKHEARYVVMGTSGIRGIVQHLFGARVLKVLKSLTVPAIVVQDDTPVKEEFKKILLPVDDIEPFEEKLNSIIPLAQRFQSKVMIYAINHPMKDEDKVRAHIKLSRQMLSDAGVNFAEMEESPTVFSAGIAKQTLNYATRWGADLIAISLADTENTGNLNFKKRPIATSPTHLVVIQAADMDGDGRDDLLVYHPDPNQSAISYQQQTDAGLDVGIKYPIPGGGRTRPPSLAVGDLDGDGCKDVAVAHQLQGLIVLSGNCKPLRRLRANGMQPLVSSSSPPGTGRRAASSQPATDTFSAPEQPAAMQRRVPVEAQSASVIRERLRPSAILFLFGLLGIASFAGLWSARSFRW